MSNDRQLTTDLDIRLDPAEVLRMMGGAHRRTVQTNIDDLVRRLINETRPLLRPRGTYIIHDIQRMTDTQLCLKNGPTFEGPIAGFLKPASRVAIFIVTIGQRLEEVAEERTGPGAMLNSYVLHAIGSAAVDAAADAMADHLLWHETQPDEATTPPFSPGYCGMPLEQQQPLFTALDADRVGVTLSPTMIMQPVKSISGLIGIGDRTVIDQHGVPCQWCKITDCQMRRD